MDSVNWQLVNILICALNVGIAVSLGLYALRRHQIQGARWFALLVLATGWVAFWYAFEAAAGEDLDAYVSFSKLEYVGLTVIPVAWLGFALAFSGFGELLLVRRVLMLLVIPLLTTLLAWTNEWHGLIWAMPRFDYSASPPIYIPDYGAWFWVNVVFAYGLYLTGSIILLQVVQRSWRLYRTQSMLLLIAASIPWIGNLSNILDITFVPGLYLQPIFFGICVILLAIAMFRLRLLDIMPLAQALILDNIPDSVIVVDKRDRVVGMNKTLLMFLNVPQANVIGAPLENLFPQFKDDIQQMRGVLNQTLERTLGERIVQIRISPVMDGRKSLRGRLLVISDITTQAKAEQAQREQLEALTIIQHVYEDIGFSSNITTLVQVALDAAVRLCNADGGWVALHREGKLRVVNFIGSYTQAALDALLDAPNGIVKQALDAEISLRTTNAAEIVTTLPNVAAQMALLIYSASGENTSALTGMLLLEGRHPRNFSEERFQLLSLLIEHLASALENAYLVEAVQAHATQLGRLYDEVSRLEQIKTDMIRIAAHDLKNPLSVLMGYLEMLSTAPAEGKLGDYTPLHEAMNRSATRMQQIITDILSLQRIEQISQQPLGIVDLGSLVQDAVAEYSSHAQEKSQTMTLELEPGIETTVQGDSAQLREAATNFISNAVKYTPQGGSIRVVVGSHLSRIRFEVIDNGYGIPQDQQARIFEPFFRAHTEETENIEGTGLGLHLVKNIITRHNGEIVFRSAYGQGSTFGFELPRLLHKLPTSERATQQVPAVIDLFPDDEMG